MRVSEIATSGCGINSTSMVSPSLVYLTAAMRLIGAGSKFRAAPNVLLFNTPEAWHSIFDKKANVKKSGFYEAWLRNNNDLNTLSCTDVALHMKKRKLLNLAFTDQSLRAAGPFMSRHIDRWNEVLLGEERNEDGWSAPKDIGTWSDYLLFDLLGDLCFGTNFGTKEPGENKLKSIPSSIAEYMKLFYPVSMIYNYKRGD
jgi:cytochrome P450